MDVYHIGEFGDSGVFAHQHTNLLYDIAEKEHHLEMKYFPKVVEEVLSNL